MDKNIERVLITEEEIQAGPAIGGAACSGVYRRNLLLLGLRLCLMVDLARAIDLPLQMDFMAVSSYGASTQSSGVVRIRRTWIRQDGRDILVVEDIIDTGLTLRYTCGEPLDEESGERQSVCAPGQEKSRPEGIDPGTSVYIRMSSWWIRAGLCGNLGISLMTS